MTRRIALLLEYDGARFAGSQLQSNARTVQGVLEEAIEKATRPSSASGRAEVGTSGASGSLRPSSGHASTGSGPSRASGRANVGRVAFAGRTDAGVHALGQVASFVTESALDVATLRRALNAWLPEDVVVRDAAEVDAAFDPRRNALSRRYRYLIDNRPVRPALERGRAWHVATPLAVDAMSAAAGAIIGTHDFAAFASRPEDAAAGTVRHLLCFDVRRRDHAVVCDVVANAFLPHQVRRMVGALVEAGKGKLAVEAYAALLEGPPASAGPAAPPHGLYLVGVEYAEDPFRGTLEP